MRKLFLLLSLCTLFAVACETPSEQNNENNNNQNGDVNTPPSAPEIVILHPEMTVSCGSNMSQITYTVLNQIEGVSTEASANVNWIHSFNYMNKGKIGFSTTANETYDVRVGIITLTYGDVTATVTVTQEGQVRLTETEVTAPYLLGLYYGDYAKVNYNYYVVFSSSDYSASNPLYAPGWKYFLDIYAPETPKDLTNIRIPNGVYTLTTAGGAEYSLFKEYSIYKEYDNSGTQIDERKYSQATLTVTDELVKLEVVFAGTTEKHIVTYSGNNYTILDAREESGGTN